MHSLSQEHFHKTSHKESEKKNSETVSGEETQTAKGLYKEVLPWFGHWLKKFRTRVQKNTIDFSQLQSTIKKACSNVSEKNLSEEAYFKFKLQRLIIVSLFIQNNC